VILYAVMYNYFTDTVSFKKAATAGPLFPATFRVCSSAR
jgi:hypothetical protein